MILWHKAIDRSVAGYIMHLTGVGMFFLSLPSRCTFYEKFGSKSRLYKAGVRVSLFLEQRRLAAVFEFYEYLNARYASLDRIGRS